MHFALAPGRVRADDFCMKTVVVPVDFSDTSGQLLAAAEAEAKRRQASLHLLHVIEPVAEVAGFETDPEMMRVRIGQNLESGERIEASRLEEMAASVEKRGMPCSCAVKLGLPADEILAAAQDKDAEIVVMGSHGHGALYHLFTGSVVTGVLKAIDRPVLVVPLRKTAK